MPDATVHVIVALLAAVLLLSFWREVVGLILIATVTLLVLGAGMVVESLPISW